MICGTASDFAFVPHDAEAVLSRLADGGEINAYAFFLRGLLYLIPQHATQLVIHPKIFLLAGRNRLWNI